MVDSVWLCGFLDKNIVQKLMNLDLGCSWCKFCASNVKNYVRLYVFKSFFNFSIIKDLT
jgi:hypothetical protein